MIKYTVKSGDSLSKIAQNHKTNLDSVLQLNDISDPNKIQVGQIINLPGNNYSDAIKDAKDQLKSGITWGTAWWSVKNLVPDVDNIKIDKDLNKDFWSKPGAYEKFSGDKITEPTRKDEPDVEIVEPDFKERKVEIVEPDFKERKVEIVEPDFKEKKVEIVEPKIPETKVEVIDKTPKKVTITPIGDTLKAKPEDKSVSVFFNKFFPISEITKKINKGIAPTHKDMIGNIGTITELPLAKRLMPRSRLASKIVLEIIPSIYRGTVGKYLEEDQIVKKELEEQAKPFRLPTLKELEEVKGPDPFEVSDYKFDLDKIDPQTYYPDMSKGILKPAMSTPIIITDQTEYQKKELKRKTEVQKVRSDLLGVMNEVEILNKQFGDKTALEKKEKLAQEIYEKYNLVDNRLIIEGAAQSKRMSESLQGVGTLLENHLQGLLDFSFKDAPSDIVDKANAGFFDLIKDVESYNEYIKSAKNFNDYNGVISDAVIDEENAIDDYKRLEEERSILETKEIDEFFNNNANYNNLNEVQQTAQRNYYQQNQKDIDRIYDIAGEQNDIYNFVELNNLKAKKAGERAEAIELATNNFLKNFVDLIDTKEFGDLLTIYATEKDKDVSKIASLINEYSKGKMWFKDNHNKIAEEATSLETRKAAALLEIEAGAKDIDQLAKKYNEKIEDGKRLTEKLEKLQQLDDIAYNHMKSEVNATINASRFLRPLDTWKLWKKHGYKEILYEGTPQLITAALEETIKASKKIGVYETVDFFYGADNVLKDLQYWEENIQKNTLPTITAGIKNSLEIIKWAGGSMDSFAVWQNDLLNNGEAYKTFLNKDGKLNKSNLTKFSTWTLGHINDVDIESDMYKSMKTKYDPVTAILPIDPGDEDKTWTIDEIMKYYNSSEIQSATSLYMSPSKLREELIKQNKFTDVNKIPAGSEVVISIGNNKANVRVKNAEKNRMWLAGETAYDSFITTKDSNIYDFVKREDRDKVIAISMINDFAGNGIDINNIPKGTKIIIPKFDQMPTYLSWMNPEKKLKLQTRHPYWAVAANEITAALSDPTTFLWPSSAFKLGTFIDYAGGSASRKLMELARSKTPTGKISESMAKALGGMDKLNAFASEAKGIVDWTHGLSEILRFRPATDPRISKLADSTPVADLLKPDVFLDDPTSLATLSVLMTKFRGITLSKMLPSFQKKLIDMTDLEINEAASKALVDVKSAIFKLSMKNELAEKEIKRAIFQWVSNPSTSRKIEVKEASKFTKGYIDIKDWLDQKKSAGWRASIEKDNKAGMFENRAIMKLFLNNPETMYAEFYRRHKSIRVVDIALDFMEMTGLSDGKIRKLQEQIPDVETLVEELEKQFLEYQETGRYLGIYYQEAYKNLTPLGRMTFRELLQNSNTGRLIPDQKTFDKKKEELLLRYPKDKSEILRGINVVQEYKDKLEWVRKFQEGSKDLISAEKDRVLIPVGKDKNIELIIFDIDKLSPELKKTWGDKSFKVSYDPETKVETFIANKNMYRDKGLPHIMMDYLGVRSNKKMEILYDKDIGKSEISMTKSSIEGKKIISDFVETNSYGQAMENKITYGNLLDTAFMDSKDGWFNKYFKYEPVKGKQFRKDFRRVIDQMVKNQEEEYVSKTSIRRGFAERYEIVTDNPNANRMFDVHHELGTKTRDYLDIQKFFELTEKLKALFDADPTHSLYRQLHDKLTILKRNAEKGISKFPLEPINEMILLLMNVRGKNIRPELFKNFTLIKGLLTDKKLSTEELTNLMQKLELAAKNMARNKTNKKIEIRSRNKTSEEIIQLKSGVRTTVRFFDGEKKTKDAMVEYLKEDIDDMNKGLPNEKTKKLSVDEIRKYNEVVEGTENYYVGNVVPEFFTYITLKKIGNEALLDNVVKYSRELNSSAVALVAKILKKDRGYAIKVIEDARKIIDTSRKNKIAFLPGRVLDSKVLMEASKGFAKKYGFRNDLVTVTKPSPAWAELPKIREELNRLEELYGIIHPTKKDRTKDLVKDLSILTGYTEKQINEFISYRKKISDLSTYLLDESDKSIDLKINDFKNEYKRIQRNKVEEIIKKIKIEDDALSRKNEYRKGEKLFAKKNKDKLEIELAIAKYPVSNNILNDYKIQLKKDIKAYNLEEQQFGKRKRTKNIIKEDIKKAQEDLREAVKQGDISENAAANDAKDRLALLDRELKSKEYDPKVVEWKNVHLNSEGKLRHYTKKEIASKNKLKPKKSDVKIFDEAKLIKKGTIDFQEEQTWGYRNRTIKNASADVTIHLAIDFTVPGERLTKNSVLNQKKKYIPIDATSLKITKARVDRIVNSLNSVNAETLNIAGNGIYDMRKYSQKQIDKFTYDLLNKVLNSPNLKNKIKSIRSGGQTGFDEAGAKAGIKLGLPTTVLAPKGWAFRKIKGVDISNEKLFKERFNISKEPDVKIPDEVITQIDLASEIEIFGRKIKDIESSPKEYDVDVRVEEIDPNESFEITYADGTKETIMSYEKRRTSIDKLIRNTMESKAGFEKNSLYGHLLKLQSVLAKKGDYIQLGKELPEGFLNDVTAIDLVSVLNDMDAGKRTRNYIADTRTLKKLQDMEIDLAEKERSYMIEKQERQKLVWELERMEKKKQNVTKIKSEIKEVEGKIAKLKNIFEETKVRGDKHSSAVGIGKFSPDTSGGGNHKFLMKRRLKYVGKGGMYINRKDYESGVPVITKETIDLLTQNKAKYLKKPKEKPNPDYNKIIVIDDSTDYNRGVIKFLEDNPNFFVKDRDYKIYKTKDTIDNLISTDEAINIIRDTDMKSLLYFFLDKENGLGLKPEEFMDLMDMSFKLDLPTGAEIADYKKNNFAAFDRLFPANEKVKLSKFATKLEKIYRRKGIGEGDKRRNAFWDKVATEKGKPDVAVTGDNIFLESKLYQKRLAKKNTSEKDYDPDNYDSEDFEQSVDDLEEQYELVNEKDETLPPDPNRPNEVKEVIDNEVQQDEFGDEYEKKYKTSLPDRNEYALHLAGLFNEIKKASGWLDISPSEKKGEWIIDSMNTVDVVARNQTKLLRIADGNYLDNNSILLSVKNNIEKEIGILDDNTQEFFKLLPSIYGTAWSNSFEEFQTMFKEKVGKASKGIAHLEKRIDEMKKEHLEKTKTTRSNLKETEDVVRAIKKPFDKGLSEIKNILDRFDKDNKFFIGSKNLQQIEKVYTKMNLPKEIEERIKVRMNKVKSLDTNLKKIEKAKDIFEKQVMEVDRIFDRKTDNINFDIENIKGKATIAGTLDNILSGVYKPEGKSILEVKEFSKEFIKNINKHLSVLDKQKDFIKAFSIDWQKDPIKLKEIANIDREIKGLTDIIKVAIPWNIAVANGIKFTAHEIYEAGKEIYTDSYMKKIKELSVLMAKAKGEFDSPLVLKEHKALDVYFPTFKLGAKETTPFIKSLDTEWFKDWFFNLDRKHPSEVTLPKVDWGDLYNIDLSNVDDSTKRLKAFFKKTEGLSTYPTVIDMTDGKLRIFINKYIPEFSNKIKIIENSTYSKNISSIIPGRGVHATKGELIALKELKELMIARQGFWLFGENIHGVTAKQLGESFREKALSEREVKALAQVREAHRGKTIMFSSPSDISSLPQVLPRNIKNIGMKLIGSDKDGKITEATIRLNMEQVFNLSNRLSMQIKILKRLRQEKIPFGEAYMKMHKALKVSDNVYVIGGESALIDDLAREAIDDAIKLKVKFHFVKDLTLNERSMMDYIKENGGNIVNSKHDIKRIKLGKKGNPDMVLFNDKISIARYSGSNPDMKSRRIIAQKFYEKDPKKRKPLCFEEKISEFTSIKTLTNEIEKELSDASNEWVKDSNKTAPRFIKEKAKYALDFEEVLARWVTLDRKDKIRSDFKKISNNNIKKFRNDKANGLREYYGRELYKWEVDLIEEEVSKVKHLTRLINDYVFKFDMPDRVSNQIKSIIADKVLYWSTLGSDDPDSRSYKANLYEYMEKALRVMSVGAEVKGKVLQKLKEWWVWNVLLLKPSWYLWNNLGDSVRAVFGARDAMLMRDLQKGYVISTAQFLRKFKKELTPSALRKGERGFRIFDLGREPKIKYLRSNKIDQILDFKFDADGKAVTQLGEVIDRKDLEWITSSGLVQATTDPIYARNIIKSMPEKTWWDKLLKRRRVIVGDIEMFASQSEQLRRQTMAFDLLFNKAYSVAQTERTVKRWLFDYRDITYAGRMMRTLFPFYCMPVDHEILTYEGWKFHSDLKIGEKVLTYSVKTESLQWEKVQDIAVFDFDGKLNVMKRGRGKKILFTDEHRWPTVNCSTGKKEILPTSKINTNYKIPTIGKYKFPNKSILSPKLAAILGWIITDGYFRWKTIKGKKYPEAVIYQLPRKYLKEILNLLNKKKLTRKLHPDSGVACVNVPIKILKKILKVYNNKKDLCKIIPQLSKESAQAMWTAMFQAEGYTTQTRPGQFGKAFSQSAEKNPEVASAFQILTFLLGRTTDISKQSSYIKKTKFISTNRKLEKEYYKGKIWCPKTPAGTWIVRHNGVMAITGNTFHFKSLQLYFSLLVKAGPGAVQAGQALLKAMEEESEALPEYMRDRVELDFLGLKGVYFLPHFGIADHFKMLLNPMKEFEGMINNPLKAAFGLGFGPLPSTIIDSITGEGYFDRTYSVEQLRDLGWSMSEINNYMEENKVNKNLDKEKPFSWLVTYSGSIFPLYGVMQRLMATESKNTLRSISWCQSKRMREIMNFFGFNIIKMEDGSLDDIAFVWNNIHNLPPAFRNVYKERLEKENPDLYEYFGDYNAMSSMRKINEMSDEEYKYKEGRTKIEAAVIQKYYNLEAEKDGRGDTWLANTPAAKDVMERFWDTKRDRETYEAGLRKFDAIKVNSLVHDLLSKLGAASSEKIAAMDAMGIKHPFTKDLDKQALYNDLYDKHGDLRARSMEDVVVIFEKHGVMHELSSLSDISKELSLSYEDYKKLSPEEQEARKLEDAKYYHAKNIVNNIIPSNIDTMPEEEAQKYWDKRKQLIDVLINSNPDYKKRWEEDTPEYQKEYLKMNTEYINRWSKIINNKKEDRNFYEEFYKQPDWFIKRYFSKHPKKALYYPIVYDYTKRMGEIVKNLESTGEWDTAKQVEALNFLWGKQNALKAWDETKPGVYNYIDKHRQVLGGQLEDDTKNYFDLFYKKEGDKEWDAYRKYYFDKPENEYKKITYPFMRTWTSLIEKDGKNNTSFSGDWFWSPNNAEARKLYGEHHPLEDGKNKLDYQQQFKDWKPILEEDRGKIYSLILNSDSWFKNEYFRNHPERKEYYPLALKLNELEFAPGLKMFFDPKNKEIIKAWEKDKPGTIANKQFWKDYTDISDSKGRLAALDFYFNPKNKKQIDSHEKNNPGANEAYRLWRDFEKIPKDTWLGRKARRAFLRAKPALQTFWNRNKEISTEEQQSIIKNEIYYTILDKVQAEGKGRQYYLDYFKAKAEASKYLADNPDLVSYRDNLNKTLSSVDSTIQKLLNEYNKLTLQVDKNEFVAKYKELDTYFLNSVPPGIKDVWLIQREYFKIIDSDEGKQRANRREFLNKHSELTEYWEVSNLPSSYFNDKAKFDKYQTLFNKANDYFDAVKKGDWATAEKMRSKLPVNPPDIRTEEGRWLLDKLYNTAMATWATTFGTYKSTYYFRSLPSWLRNEYYRKHPESKMLSYTPMYKSLTNGMAMEDSNHPDLAWARRMMTRYGKDIPSSINVQVEKIMRKWREWDERSDWSKARWTQWWTERSMKKNYLRAKDLEDIPLLRIELERVKKIYSYSMLPMKSKRKHGIINPFIGAYIMLPELTIGLDNDIINNNNNK